MSVIKSLISKIAKTTAEIIPSEAEIINALVGHRVVVTTEFYGEQIGIIVSLGLSPYYTEQKQNVWRAYVVAEDGHSWMDYLTAEQVGKGFEQYANLLPKFTEVA